jgi:hypothetical protein
MHFYTAPLLLLLQHFSCCAGCYNNAEKHPEVTPLLLLLLLLLLYNNPLLWGLLQRPDKTPHSDIPAAACAAPLPGSAESLTLEALANGSACHIHLLSLLDDVLHFKRLPCSVLGHHLWVTQLQQQARRHKQIPNHPSGLNLQHNMIALAEALPIKRSSITMAATMAAYTHLAWIRDQ